MQERYTHDRPPRGVAVTQHWPSQFTARASEAGLQFPAGHSIVLFTSLHFPAAHPSPCHILIFVPNMNMFWGDRFGKVIDPFGHSWSIAQHVEDVPPAEMGPRMQEWMKNMPPMPKK